VPSCNPLRPLLLCLTLCLTAGFGSAWAACLAPAQGALAPLEAVAFRAPAQALAQLEKQGALATTQAPAERAAALAIAAEAARQLGHDKAALEHANAGLQALAPDRVSDLALRLRAVRAMELDEVTDALAELDAATRDAHDRPLARGCLLRDSGWLKLNTNHIDAALGDLIQAYALLGKTGDRDEQMVTTGRLSIAYARGGDQVAALALVDETATHFRQTGARVRLTTALIRRAGALSALKRWPEAEASLREALAISREDGDASGASQVLTSLCQVVGRQEREAEALALCDEAERTMRSSGTADDESLHTLVLLRVEALRSRAPNAAELAALVEVLKASTGASDSRLARVYQARALALAARGDHAAAYADQRQVLALQRAATDGERINSQAAMRVRFETDRALARGAVLAEQNKIGKERLVWVALAGLACLAAAGGLAYSLLLNRRHQLRLTQVAERDDLTGLPNRRKIMEDAEQQFALARRRGSALVIGMCDIDHFKRINDTHGHAGGDLVLGAFGKTARPALRSTDSLGRWGGEEFLLVLPDCALQDGAAVAERMRTLLGAHSVQDSVGQELRFTVSIGLAMATAADTNLQAVLQRADAALYVAKQQGRDRVVVDSSAAPPAPALAEGLAQTTVPLQRRKGERRQRSAASSKA
jgi:diguanylate cyclase (GGDEF)-like protein